MFWKPGFLKRYWSSNKTLWLLIAASFSIGLLFSLRPLPELLDQCADDAFYYLTIARNIVSGKGISFDGISATNGFHPLYLTLLSALFKVFSPSP